MTNADIIRVRSNLLCGAAAVALALIAGPALAQTVDPNEVVIVATAVPGPRSIWASPMSWAMKSAEEV